MAPTALDVRLDGLYNYMIQKSQERDDILLDYTKNGELSYSAWRRRPLKFLCVWAVTSNLIKVGIYSHSYSLNN
jgi:hypothetical protein